MRINYPIRYALMPIVEQVGWTHGMHEMEREYDIVCYIVSKCYLINDSTKYMEDGRNIKEYEVVFPYQLMEFNRWKRFEPTYNLMHGNCINSNKVDMIFDSYEEALNYAVYKNERLSEKMWNCLPISKNIMEKIQEKKDMFDEKLAKYKVLEEQILLNTGDMEIGNNKKLNNIFKIENGEGKILSCSIYEIIKLFVYKNFLVYNISQEQYDNLMNLVNEDKIDDIKQVLGSARGLLIHNKNDDFIKLAIEEDGVYYIRNGCIGYNLGLDRVTKDTFEKIDDDTLIFYTTETLSDLLNSYKEHLEIDLMQFKGSILKKKYFK